MGNLLGTQAALVNAERDAAPETIAQVATRALELSEAGAHREALALLDRALKIRGDDPQLHAARGWALENLEPDCMPEARLAYETAIALDPNQIWARAGLAEVLGRQGEGQASIRIHQEVVEQAATRAVSEHDLLELLGWCQYRLGRLDEAVDTFRRALALDEAWVSVRFDLGLALLVRGDPGGATREYQAGLDHLAQRDEGWRLGPVLVALDDLDEALKRVQSVHASFAAGEIRRQLERAADDQRGIHG